MKRVHRQWVTRLESCSENAHVWLCAKCMRKMTCEMYLSTDLVGYSESQKKMKRLLQNLFMSSTNFWTCPTRKRLRKSWSVRKMTELATNILDESDKFVFGPLVLLASEWTVMKRALSRWNHHRLPRHTSTRTPRLCRWIAPWRWFR